MCIQNRLLFNLLTLLEPAAADVGLQHRLNTDINGLWPSLQVRLDAVQALDRGHKGGPRLGNGVAKAFFVCKTAKSERQRRAKRGSRNEGGLLAARGGAKARLRDILRPRFRRF